MFDYKPFDENVDDVKEIAIVLRDKLTKWMASHVCECKGSADEWIVKEIVNDINGLGYIEVVLKSDGETALVQLLEETKKRRAHPTIIIHSPAYDPQSNGLAERAVQEFIQQLRALKIQ